ncbi:MAG: hypothetical protein J5972_03290 [Eubacterium sp.]|nr:hypothetical protein [Eubacterium sp.]
MNSAKKILKNEGVEKKKVSSGKKNDSVSAKFKVLLAVGLVLALGFGSAVGYLELRPKTILVVKSKDGSVSDTLVYKEAMYDIYNAESMYNMYTQMLGESYWDRENADGEGRNGSSAAKKEIMDNLKQREILCLEAEKNGVALTADEKKTADENVKSATENMTDAQKKMEGLSQSEMKQSAYRQALADKYKDQVIASLGINEDAIKAGVSKKDNRQYTLQYYSISKKDDDGKALDAKTLKKNKDAIDAVAKKAPSAKDFTKDIITDENNDQADDKTGVEYGTENLISKDMDSSSFLTKKQRKEIIKMKNGQITGVLETDDAYYVVKMVNNDDPATYNSECEQAVESEKESQFETKYKKDIKTQYTTEVQKYWSGRVKLGGITTSAQ